MPGTTAPRRGRRLGALLTGVVVGLAGLMVAPRPATAAGPSHVAAAPPAVATGTGYALAAAVGSPARLLASAVEEPDDEGGTETLRTQLTAASAGFVAAKGALARSRQEQRELTRQLTGVQRQVAGQTAAVGRLVSLAYRNGRISPIAALLRADGPEAFLDGVAALDAVAANEQTQLGALRATLSKINRAQSAINLEILQQQRQVAIMAARKTQAERALVAAGGGQNASGPGGGVGGSATPAPRNRDGSWPSESCRLDDPTTSGCITPRTRHALNQAKAAGFTRYVSCFRSGGSGEHPQGKACDFAAATGGFAGTASGNERRYGDNLAGYFVRNADRLGVLYVIWFRRIWLPSSGWRTYRGGGDPASDHTNHVHLSEF